MFNFQQDKDNESQPAELAIDKKRQQHSEQIRKNAREDIIMKRRNLNANIDKIAYQGAQQQRLMVGNAEFSDRIDEFGKREYELSDIPKLAMCIQSKDPASQHQGIIGIRKLLSRDNNPPIQQVIDLNLVPKMIEMVKQQQYPYLQMEATWALTNVASGTSTQCQCVVDKGGIPIFIKLLSSPMEITIEQAVWALGNIAGDTHFTRDSILKLGGLQQLIRVVQTTHNPNIFKQGGWAIANLCRGTPRPKYEAIQAATPSLARVLKDTSVTDTDIISDCCWALSYLSDGTKKMIQKVVDTGVAGRLVELLSHPHQSVLLPALRAVGNIATGSEMQTDQLLKANVLFYFLPLLSHKKTIIRRECVWAMSNIAAGSLNQAILIFSNQEIVSRLLEMFESDHLDVKKQIGWIFSNFCNSAEPLMYCTFIKQYGLMKYFVTLLSNNEEAAVEVGLEGISNFLILGDKIKGKNDNPMIIQLNSFNGIDKLQNLQTHKSPEIYKKTFSILQTFFLPENPLE